MTREYGAQVGSAISNPHVLRANGTERTVKNLGWLLSHAQHALAVRLYDNGLNGHEASLVVSGDGWLFYAPFKSREIALQFARRNAFAHCHHEYDFDPQHAVVLRNVRDWQRAHIDAAVDKRVLAQF